MIYTKTIIYLEKTKPNKGVLAQYKKSVIIWIRSASIRPIRGANGSIRYRKTLCFFIGGLYEKTMETILVL